MKIDYNIWLFIGFFGQAIFGSRFLVQWFYSEKAKKSYIPVGFWYLSIFGGCSLLVYAISRQDPVIICGQIFGLIVYIRNLVLIYRENKNEKK